MEKDKKEKMYKQITDKLGFTLKEYNEEDLNDHTIPHERDNIPNPFEKLSMEELLFLRENNYFLSE